MDRQHRRHRRCYRRDQLGLRDFRTARAERRLRIVLHDQLQPFGGGLAAQLRELVEDLRSDKVQGLERDRKALLYSDYVWQIKSVLSEGERAIQALAGQLGPEAANYHFNSRDGDPIPVSGT